MSFGYEVHFASFQYARRVPYSHKLTNRAVRGKASIHVGGGGNARQRDQKQEVINRQAPYGRGAFVKPGQYT